MNIKRIDILSAILAVFCLCTCGAFAASAPVDITEQSTETIYYDDGSYAEITLTVEETPVAALTSVRSVQATTKYITSTKTYTYKTSSGTNVFAYKLTGTFKYTGSSATATSATTSYTIYKSGWSRKSNSSYTSGSSAYGNATFASSLSSKSVSLKITCDKNGNIS